MAKPRPTPTRRVLAPIQVAAEHGACSPRTIRRRIADGSLTGYRMGPRLIRVDLNELDAMLQPIPTAGVVVMQPDSSLITQPDLGANQEGARQDEFLSVPTLARQAAHIIAAHDLRISGSRVRRLVRRFVREGRGDIDFRTWFIAYADPVGEAATRNVLRERGF